MLKELTGEFQAFLNTFVAFLGFIIWAWIGRLVSRYTTALENEVKMPWTVVFAELPIAVGMGVILGGGAEYATKQGIIESELVQSAFVAAGAYLGPKLFEDGWKKWITGNKNHETNVYVHKEHDSEHHPDKDSNPRGSNDNG